MSALSETFKAEAFQGSLSGLDEASGFGYGASLEGPSDIFGTAMESVWDFVSRQSDPFAEANTVQQGPQSLAEFAQSATPDQQEVVQQIEKTLNDANVKQVTEIKLDETATGAPQKRQDVEANVATAQEAMTSAINLAEDADKAATQEQAEPKTGGSFLFNTAVDFIAAGALGPAGVALTMGTRAVGNILKTPEGANGGSFVTHNQPLASTPSYTKVKKGEEGYRANSDSPSSNSYDAAARQSQQGPSVSSPIDQGSVQIASQSVTGIKQLVVKDHAFVSLQRDHEFYQDMKEGFDRRADKGVVGTVDNMADAINMGAGDVAHDAFKQNNVTPTLNGTVV